MNPSTSKRMTRLASLLAAGALAGAALTAGTIGAGAGAASASAVAPAAPAAPAVPAAVPDHDRVVVYYQKNHTDTGTYISPLPLVTQNTGVDVINLAAVRMNQDVLNLNDWLPSDPRYDQMWADLATIQQSGVAVVGMIGGAENQTWENLDDDYDTQYARLKDFIDTYHLDGIDLDIETDTEIGTAEHVIEDLRADFGPGFLITMSPVSRALEGDDENLSGFDYDQLYADVGDDIDWFNAQFYCNWGEPTVDDYDAIIDYQQSGEGAGIPSQKIVMIALTNESNCPEGAGWIPLDQLQQNLRALVAEHPDFGGVAGWEYFNSRPGGEAAPWEWAALMRQTLDEPAPTPTPTPTPAPDPSTSPTASAAQLANTGANDGADAMLALIAALGIAAGGAVAAAGVVLGARSTGRGR
jgi:hypothetical protein